MDFFLERTEVSPTTFSRKDFLKLTLLSLGSLGALAFQRFLPPEDQAETFGLGRVTYDRISVRSKPSFQAEVVGWKKRDRLVNLLEEIRSPYGPSYNPRWYRVIGGYVHGAYVQRVQVRHNKPLKSVPEDGQIGEVTVPISQSLGYHRRVGWKPLYRLYYQSTHWITAIEQGPDGRPWYQITDDRLHIHYYVPATHLRPVQPEELTPISPWIPRDEKRIRVSLEEQTVTCYEGNQEIFHTEVSTGAGGPTNNDIPRVTPEGRFRIGWKMPVRHMGDGEVTNDIYAYELPGVPWCCYFVSTGVAFHGTYWHDNYGNKMSSGCVNMRPDEAKWLYRWTMPKIDSQDWFADGVGTIVEVL